MSRKNLTREVHIVDVLVTDNQKKNKTNLAEIPHRINEGNQI